MASHPFDNSVWFDIVEQLPDGATLSSAVYDEHGAVIDLELVYMNAQARAGQPDPAAAIGRLGSELWPQMVANGSFAACLRVLETGEPEAGDFWWTEQATYRNGGYRWSASRLPGGLLMWVLRDATDAIRRLADERNRFAAAFEAANAGMALVALDGTIIDANERLAEMLGTSPVALVGRQAGSITGDGRPEAVERAIRRALDEPGTNAVAEARLVAETGISIWARVSVALVRDVDEVASLLIMHVLDVSAREGRELELAHAVTHDALTGLPNRSLFIDHLQLVLERQGSLGVLGRVTVAVIDLDNFQVINGTLGHREGDRVLREVARRLALLTPPGDTVARLGGDTFALVCVPASSPPDPAAFFAEVSEALAEPIGLGAHRVVVQASMGLAFPAAIQDPEGALRDADTALHEAKRSGRATFAVFDEQLRARALSWFTAEARLRSALAARRIQSYFQPVVDLIDGITVGFEALARWEQDGVMAGPSSILEMAEVTGLVVPLSEAVAEQALAGMGRWQLEHLATSPRPWLSFNISPRQLHADGFVVWLLGRCAASRISPADVVLEITERTMLQAGPQTVYVLEELRQHRFRIAIDDFGVEYSSLAYLRSFPVDVIKIDRVFVAPAAKDERNHRLLAAIVGLAQALDVEVIAEGIETPEEREAVSTAGCRLGQGFGLARPRHHLESV